jgi:hypothetical protein
VIFGSIRLRLGTGQIDRRDPKGILAQPRRRTGNGSRAAEIFRCVVSPLAARPGATLGSPESPFLRLPRQGRPGVHRQNHQNPGRLV